MYSKKWNFEGIHEILPEGIYVYIEARIEGLQEVEKKSLVFSIELLYPTLIFL